MRKENLTLRFIRPRMLLFLTALCSILLLAPESSPARQIDGDGVDSRPLADSLKHSKTTGEGLLLAQRHRQNGGSRNRYEQWQRMGPDEKETLRRRMDQWNQMPPDDRQRYERRFEQWKKLSPEEQGQIDRKLENWKGLSPADKEDVRKKFR